MEEVRNAFGDYLFLLILYVISLAGIGFFFKGKRKSFVVPAILITIAVVNPVFYKAWARLNEMMVYWRTLWMIPLLPVCAAAAAMIVEKTRKAAGKSLIVVAGSLVIILFGSFLYVHAYPPYAFGQADNSEKLPKNVVNVGQILCEMEEEPYVVADSSLSVYLRQYSGRIHSPYARSVTYGTPGQSGRDMYAALAEGDYVSLARMMANNDYSYLVTENWAEGKEQKLKAAGFELVQQVDCYGVYRNHSPRTEIRTYNDLHQVTGITFVNEKGETVNGSDGYASVEYEYDRNGKVAYEFYRDAEGVAVPDSSGRAGYRREWNYLGQLVSETCLNVEGEPAAEPFVTRKLEYDWSHWLIREAYFDKESRPMLRTDTGYASIQYVRNNEGDVIEERTYDTEGRQNIRSTGYSLVKRTFNGDHQVLTESYFDESEQPINISLGYQKRVNEYTGNGKLSLTWFYDDRGNRINCGSSFFHEFLQKISLQDHLVFISVKDEGTGALTTTLLEDLQKIGVKTDLNGKYRHSYYAVVSSGETKEEISSDREVRSEGEILGVRYSISSAGFWVGSKSSIVIDGVEYSKNVRGMNIVIYDLKENKVMKTISFDTYSSEMRVTDP